MRYSLKYLLVVLVIFCSPVFALSSITLSCDMPTTRVNGDLLPLDEINRLEFRVFTDADRLTPLEVHTETECTSTFNLRPGIYWYDVQVVDEWDNASGFSEKLDHETLPNSSSPTIPMLRFVVPNTVTTIIVQVGGSS